MTGRVDLSVVVPIFDEEESLPILHGEIATALDSLDLRSEILYVDDCSRDTSLRCMLELRDRDPRVRVIKFRRNSGQTAALAAGFDESRGQIVVTLDGDLQNDPADIPGMIERLEQGFDVVAGWRKDRQDGFVLRRFPSILANRLIARVTGVDIHDTGCTLKAFRGPLIKSLTIYAEQHRFLPVLSAGSGAKVTEMVVNHRARRFGSSKYGINRALRVLVDLLVIKFIAQFSHRPMQYFGAIAVGIMVVGALFGVAAALGLYASMDSTEISGITLEDWSMAVVTALAVFFSGFVYFAFLGLLAELAVKASGMHQRSTLDRILNELHG